MSREHFLFILIFWHFLKWGLHFFLISVSVIFGVFYGVRGGLRNLFFLVLGAFLLLTFRQVSNVCKFLFAFSLHFRAFLGSFLALRCAGRCAAPFSVKLFVCVFVCVFSSFRAFLYSLATTGWESAVLLFFQSGFMCSVFDCVF